MNENILSLNVPNIVTVGLILAIWSVIFVLASQGFRKAAASGNGG